MLKKKAKQNPEIKSKSAVKKQRVNFSFIENGAKEVALAGDFNNWSPKAHQMKRDIYGIWSKTVALSPGRYEYKFVVDGNWKEDPNNNQKHQNSFGTYNSILNLSPK